MTSPENRKSGYDIDLGNACSQNAFSWAKKTFENREGLDGELSMDLDGGFSNMLRFNSSRIGIASDGIGTKIELAERTKLYDTLGFDLVAMVADDLAAGGFVPTNISNILDVDHLDLDTVDELMAGLHDAANDNEMAVTGGEIAELGNRINGYGDGMHFNWCSTAIGVLHPGIGKPIDGSAITVNDAIITLKSDGFRSNGFSILRTIMEKKFGDKWHDEAYDDEMSWGEALLTPSLIYSPLISFLLDEEFILNGIAHITGGGIKDNLARILKSPELGAKLPTLFPPTAIMRRLLEITQVSRDQAYKYWNMGNGMLLVCAEEQAKDLIAKAKEFGYSAQVAGTVTDQPGIKI